MPDRLTFYFFPSPYGIDWSSPARLALTTAINRLNWLPKPRHPIGHVNIELVSETETPARRFLTGMVAEDTAYQRRAILRDQVGLGILFFSAPGHLETAQEIEPQFQPRHERGKMSMLHLKVHPSVRERLELYFREFQAKKGFHSYGLPNRPLHLEGSGCSAFGASFLEVAGLDLPEFRQNWSRTLLIPESLIGDPTTQRRVNFARILLNPFSRWAQPQEPHRSLFFWDPDLMHDWLLKTWKSLNQGAALFIDRPHRLSRQNQTLELEIDLSHLPAREGPIWPQGVL